MSRAMKDSGIPWIGEIPSHWETCFIKQVMRNKSVKGYPDEQVLSLNRDYGVVPKDSRDDNHNVTSEDTSGYKLVDVGDFVINKMKAWQGSMAVSEYRGIISPAYYICRFTAPVYKKYIHYLLRNETYKAEYLRLSTGLRVGQWDLNVDDFLHIPMVLPPIPEQQAIADFLDKKCSEIDEMVLLQENIVEELKAYKQSVITETVCRGLNPDVPTKDSGIEWIGQIPAGWTVAPFKTVYSLGKGLSITKADLVEKGVPVISYGQIHSKLNSGTSIIEELIRFVPETYLSSNTEALVKEGDIIFADTSEDLGGCGNCVYVDKKETLFAGYHTIIARNQTEEHNNYFSYLFLTDCWRKQIRSVVNGVKLFSIPQRILSATSIIIPPIEEQCQIGRYLDNKCTIIDTLISIKKSKIDALKEYKKSIIYEYITGKKEVPYGE